MLLDSIPFEIVAAILDFAYPPSFSKYWLWNPALSLVHVCRSWRNHLLPKLHGTAYVLTTGSLEPHVKNGAYSFKGTLNATLSLGHGHYVRKIVVFDRFLIPLPHAQMSTPNIWTTVEFPDNMWPGLKHLQVNVFACTLPDDQKNTYLCSIPKSSGNFLEYLPNVAAFVFQYAFNRCFVSASVYSVFDPHNVVIHGTDLTTKPQSLCLCLHSYTQILADYSAFHSPTKSPSMLTSLDLLSIQRVPTPMGLSRLFTFPTDNKILNLYRLKSLKFNFSGALRPLPTDIADEEQIDTMSLAHQLYFPNLQKLALCSCASDLSFLAYLGRSLPQMVKYVDLTGEAGDLSAILPMFTKIGRLDINLWDIAIPNDFHMLSFFDMAFGSQSVADQVTLSCSGKHLPLNLGGACWPKLVDLSLDASMPVDQVIKLLDCLPCLEKFSIVWISEVSSDDLTDINWKTVPPLKPLNSKIWRFDVGANRFTEVSRFPIENILYFAARLVNLQSIILTHEDPIDTSEFMDALHEKYPHTAGVSVSFKLLSHMES